MIGRTRWFSAIHALTWSSTSRSSAAVRPCEWLKSKRSLSGADVGARLADVVAQAPAERRLEQVGRRVVALGRVAGRPVDAGDDALAGVELAGLEHGEHGLVLAQADDLGHPGAAVARGALDHPAVADLAPPAA